MTPLEEHFAAHGFARLEVDSPEGLSSAEAALRKELEEGKARMEEELMATAQMVTDLEMKLQTKDHELLGLQEEMLELDAGTAKVKKQLQLEFQSKLDSMEANQALWPQAFARTRAPGPAGRAGPRFCRGPRLRPPVLGACCQLLCPTQDWECS